MDKIKIVFFGTPTFAVPILEFLIKDYNVVLVVSQPDREKDKKGNLLYTPIKKIAIENDIELLQPFKIREEYQVVLDYNPDLIITCAYGQILPDVILNYPKYGCINVHGSLLPKLRGGAPIHWAIINGYSKTGITIMDMTSKMDAGDIISQREIEILETDILDNLYEKMSILGRDLLKETLPSIINNTASRIKQNEADVTYGLNIKKEEEKIDFNKEALAIHNLVRGLNSNPGAYAYMDNKRIKIYKTIILDRLSKGQPGLIVDIDEDSIIVNTKDKLLAIKEIKVEGKSRCLVSAYLNGINKEKLIGRVFNE